MTILKKKNDIQEKTLTFGFTFTPLSDRNVAKRRYITPKILKTTT